MKKQRVDYHWPKPINSLADPLKLFRKWYRDADRSGIIEPNAMALATISPKGRPCVRYLLLKGQDQRGFIFYTNYHSNKGIQIAYKPFGAIVFYWDKIERQVRISGTIKKLSRVESDRYFRLRPRDAQISAAISKQSAKLVSRTELLATFNAVSQAYKGRNIPLPKNWGGYVLVPEEIEFWQGMPDRLHDRVLYVRKTAKRWASYRLYP